VSDVTQLPVNLAIDLDTVERPASEVKPPFTAQIGGRTITMLDPSDLDWRDLMAMSTPQDFIRLSMSKPDREFLATQDIPGWKFNLLMEAFYRHFDLEELAEKARREQTLNPRAI
jgi:hypothetical protein